MQKKIILYLCCLLTFFTFFTCFSYAADNEISNSYDYIDTSIYHAFINYLFANDGDKYSQYINNMHCTIYQLSLNKDDFFINFNINDLSSKKNNINYNKYVSGNYNSTYYTYIAFFTKTPFIYYEIDKNSDGFHYSENLKLNNTSDVYFVMAMKNNGFVEFYNCNSFNGGCFEFNSGCHLVYTDDIIYQDGTALEYATPSNSNSDLFDLDITSNETGSSLYNKIMALYNSQYNAYARLWASGDKPTIAIFNNSNVNCIVPLINNNEYIQNKYIAIFSTCRLCEYEQNNNSRHFNTLTYGDEILHIITFDEGLNHYNFYNLLSRNYQADAIVLTGISGDELLFCNSNIIKKSNANDFLVSGNNQYTYYIK